MLPQDELRSFRLLPLSLIIFHVAPSNNTISQSVLELGHTTSHAHSQSAQSWIWNVSVVQLVSVIVTVVVFQALLLVIDEIQLPAGQVGH